MPIVRFSQEDLDKTKTVEAGFYKAKVSSVTEALSSKKDSTNWIVIFELVVNDSTRILKHYFNDKGKGYMTPFIEALINAKVEVGINYELAEFVGCELWLEVAKELSDNPNYKGRPVNKIIGFQSLQNPPF